MNNYEHEHEAQRCVCLECGEAITGDVAEFQGLPYRTFHVECVDALGAIRAHLLARTAPRSAWSNVTGAVARDLEHEALGARATAEDRAEVDPDYPDGIYEHDEE